MGRNAQGEARRPLGSLGPLLFAALLALFGCSAGARPAAAPACDQVCQDGTAMRGVREAVKLAYNFIVMGKPEGPQQGMSKCEPAGSKSGSVVISGTAMANALQGSSFVDLTYVVDNCLYSVPPDATANQNYSLTFSGTLTEHGTLAVQPSATSAVDFHSDSFAISGTVYDPPLDYAVSDCVLDAEQSGNSVVATLCGRNASFTF